MIKYKYVLLFFGFSSGIFSQSVLTIDDAIKIGMEKNYSVLIVKNEKYQDYNWIYYMLLRLLYKIND